MNVEELIRKLSLYPLKSDRIFVADGKLCIEHEPKAKFPFGIDFDGGSDLGRGQATTYLEVPL